MAMSDCEKCWDTPCECGWEYRNWDKDRLIAMRGMLQKLIDGTHVYSKRPEPTMPIEYEHVTHDYGNYLTDVPDSLE